MTLPMNWLPTIRSVDHREMAVAAQVHSLQMRAYAQEAALLGAIYFPPLERTIEDVRSCAEVFRVATLGSKLVGAVSVGKDEEGLGTNVASLVVEPEFQRRGVGRALLTAVANAHGVNGLTVQTGAKNVPALALYEQFGFVELRRWLVGREPLELVRLRRAPTI